MARADPGSRRRPPVPAGTHRYTLDGQHFLRLRRCAGVEVACTDGQLWITQEGSPDDVLLHAGQRWRVPRGGPVLVGAFGPAVAQLMVPERPASPWWRVLADRVPTGLRLRTMPS